MADAEPIDSRLCSSPCTFLSTFVVPALFPLGFAVGSIVSAVRNDTGGAVFFGLVAFISGLVAIHSARQVKHVCFTQACVIVSDYFSKVEIPWSDVEAVEGYRWSRNPLYILRFRNETRYGRVVYFLLYTELTPELLSKLRSQIDIHAGAPNK